MALRNYLLFKLTAGLKCRLISPADEPYLERYYLFTILGRTFYLHRFVSADAERHVHNHPFDAFAIVLAGSYIEETVVDICPHAGQAGCLTSKRVVQWFNQVDGAKFHRISDAAPGTWTLFTHGHRLTVDCGMATRLKGWGFLENRDNCTVFVPAMSDTEAEWWHNAKTGRNIGRMPL